MFKLLRYIKIDSNVNIGMSTCISFKFLVNSLQYILKNKL